MSSRSLPKRIRSRASSNSSRSTRPLSLRAARSAASLTRFSRSAPEKPTVAAATAARSTVSDNGTFFACTSRIICRAFLCGSSRVILRSKRPGRRSAGSRTSGRLVAAITTTASCDEKPSISARIWFSVCSRSSWPPPRPVPRARPTESISSTKMIAGASCLAFWNMSRTREAPTPTNISTNSEPLIEKNGTPASPATARARSVLPVPGGPISSTPLGTLTPSFWNFSALFR